MRRLGIVNHFYQLVLKYLDFLGKSWEHHADVLKNSEKINTMDLNSLLVNLKNYEENKALRKDIVKELSEEKFVALVSRKEAMKLISESDDLD
mgnify:CR=1 FL=1